MKRHILATMFIACHAFDISGFEAKEYYKSTCCHDTHVNISNLNISCVELKTAYQNASCCPDGNCEFLLPGILTMSIWTKDNLGMNIVLHINTNNVENTQTLLDFGIFSTETDFLSYNRLPAHSGPFVRRHLMSRLDMSDMDNWIFGYGTGLEGYKVYTATRFVEPYEVRLASESGALAWRTPALFAINQDISMPNPVCVGTQLDFQSTVRAVDTGSSTNYVGAHMMEGDDIYELHRPGYTAAPGSGFGIYKSNVRLEFDTGENTIDDIIRDPDASNMLLATVTSHTETKLVKLNEDTLTITPLVTLKAKRCLTRLRLRGRELFILLASVIEDVQKEQWLEGQDLDYGIVKEYVVMYNLDTGVTTDVLQMESIRNDNLDAYDVPIVFSSPTDIGLADDILVVSRWSAGYSDDVLLYDLTQPFPLSSPVQRKEFLNQDEHGYDPWLQPGWLDKNPNGLRVYTSNNERFVLMGMKYGLMFLNIDNMDRSKFVPVCNIPEYSIVEFIVTDDEEVVFDVSPTTGVSEKNYMKVDVSELFAIATNTMIGGYGDVPIA